MSILAKSKSGQIQPGMKAYKRGGAVHDDAAQDRALIRREVKKEAAGEKKCSGGRVKGKR